MEIEAKFVVPDVSIARQLRAVQKVAEFACSAPTRITVRDTFFDTRANELRETKHVLRVRQRSDGHTILTFKAPALSKPSRSAVSKPSRSPETSKVLDVALHSRPETEVEIPASRTPRVLHLDALPARIKKLAAPLITENELYPLFTISQAREIKLLRAGRRIIAEWSLDYVKFRAGARQKAFYELEVELKKTGGVEDLEEIAAWLEREFRLPPMRESKFARALQFIQTAP